MVLERNAEISLHQPLQILEVLDVDRLVQSKVAPQLLYGLRGDS